MSSATPGRGIAAIYCRVSSQGQEDNASLPTQEAGCRSYAAECGYAVSESHVHREVFTASELWQRPQLSLLREAIRGRAVAAVICYALDRLSRKQTHLAILVDECERAGVALLFVTEEFERSAVGDFIRSAKAFAAELEREKIAERTRRGLHSRSRSGKPVVGCRALYGYRWADEKKSRLILDPHTAPTVRRIFAEVVKGRPLARIAADLNTEGVPTPTGKPHWWRSALHTIVKHPAYTGRASAMRYATRKSAEGVVHLSIRDEAEQIALPEGTIPALVDAVTYQAAQERLLQNKSGSSGRLYDREAFLLRGGYVRCGYCGKSVGARWYPGRGGQHPNYALDTATDSHRDCQPVAIRAHLLDAAVWARVEELLNRPEAIAAELARLQADDPTAFDLAAIDRQMQEAEKKRGNLAKRLALFDDDDLGARLRELVAERALVAARRAVWEHATSRLADLERWCRDVAVTLGEMTYAQRRLALDTLGVSVKLYRKGHTPRYEITASIPFPDEGESVSLSTTRSD
jgi:site-specific DNA recombinase